MDVATKYMTLFLSRIKIEMARNQEKTTHHDLHIIPGGLEMDIDHRLGGDRHSSGRERLGCDCVVCNC